MEAGSVVFEFFDMFGQEGFADAGCQEGAMGDKGQLESARGVRG
jgi:hypothetical protein